MLLAFAGLWRVALGSLAGSAVAPTLRRVVREERILVGVLGLTAVAGVLTAAFASRTTASLLAMVLGASGAAGKLAFDSIVQRDAPDANRGRSFARFETRFQLIWVIGGFVPVVVALPARVGFLVVAGAGGFALFSYLAGLRGVRGRPGGLRTSS